MFRLRRRDSPEVVNGPIAANFSNSLLKLGRIPVRPCVRRLVLVVRLGMCAALGARLLSTDKQNTGKAPEITAIRGACIAVRLTAPQCHGLDYQAIAMNRCLPIPRSLLAVSGVMQSGAMDWAMCALISPARSVIAHSSTWFPRRETFAPSRAI